MVGILVQLIISWVLLTYVEKKDLSALGFTPTRERLKHFVVGLLIPLIFVSAFWLTVSSLVQNPYSLNPNFTAVNLLSSAWFMFKSVAFEELIFRGALLYILIKRLPGNQGILISATGFGIYHWFSYGMAGQPANMIFVFVTTGLVGLMLAAAFQKTQSLYLPFALHFGYNFTSMVIFSTDKGIGPQLLVKAFEKDPVTPGIFASSSFMILYFIGFPLLAYAYVRTIASTEET